MPGLNDLIAASGEALYENVRKGFYERPEEERSRKLEELNITQQEQNVGLKDVQLKQAQQEQEEFESTADIRAREQDEQRRKLTPEYIAEQESNALEKIKLGIEEQRQRINQAASKEEREVLTYNATQYNDLVLGASNQDDLASSIEYIRQNKQKFLDFGLPSEDATIEQILNADPEEQKYLLNVLQKGNKYIADANLEYQKELGKMQAKASGEKPAEPFTGNEQSYQIVKGVLSDNEAFKDLDGSVDKDSGKVTGQKGVALSTVTNTFNDIISGAKQERNKNLDRSAVLEALQWLVAPEYGTMTDNAVFDDEFNQSTYTDYASALKRMLSDYRDTPTQTVVTTWKQNVQKAAVQRKKQKAD